MHPSMDPAAVTDEKTPTDGNTGPAPVPSPPSSDIIVQKYQDMFASRFSDNDPFFQPYKNKGMDPPPIVENYFIRQQKRSWSDYNRGQRNNQDRDYGYDHPSKRQHYDYESRHHERAGGWGQQGRNQQWGHTSYNQDWRQRDRPGQGSHPQRSQQDRYSDGRHDRWSNERHSERHHDSRDRSRDRKSSHQPHDEWT